MNRIAPPYLHIFLKDGSRKRLDLGGVTQDQRGKHLKYWTERETTRTALLAWQ